jgi:hypothetical protein
VVVQTREALVREIVHTLKSHEAYVAQLDARPLQRVVDMRWAMKTAARRLGQPVHIDERRAGARVMLVATTDQ